eukprot:305895-Amphidinium_carterae.1
MKTACGRLMLKSRRTWGMGVTWMSAMFWCGPHPHGTSLCQALSHVVEPTIAVLVRVRRMSTVSGLLTSGTPAMNGD